MNKTQLIAAVASDTNLSTEDARKAVDAVISNLSSGMRNGDTVTIHGFGSFSAADKAARMGRNPNTGQATEIAARKAPRFKPSAALKAALNA